MTAAVWWLQAGYATGFLCIPLAGSKRRRVAALGWFCGILSEGCFAAWATIGHVPSAYPWIVAWGAVYVHNWLKWRRQGAVPRGREA